MDLHVSMHNTILFKKKIVINMGIGLYNTVPDNINNLNKYKAF